MKITTWNVNGLRAVHRNGHWDAFLRTNPDVFCLQETKAEAEQLPVEVREVPGYTAHFSSSKLRKGYSGVAIYSKTQPRKVEYGIGIRKFDDEGRILVAEYPGFVLLNIYFPNGGSSPERLQYKLDFYDAFLTYIDGLRALGKQVIFCGDVNTAHEAIDLARPKENEQNTGFLSEERAWIDEVIAHGYTDIFRHLYPTKTSAYTYWDMKTGARDRNVGWRIDYFFTNTSFVRHIKDIRILSDIYGSDHCPVEMVLSR
ncbi:MAG: exodeoxyribonuclease III [Minisyncoccota bacterium]